MKFIARIHRSIFDPEFYLEAITYKARVIVGHLFLLCLTASIITGIAHTYYASDAQKGLPPVLAQAFGPMRIDGGNLDPKRTTPFVPSSALLSQAFAIYLNIAEGNNFLPDSFMIIDTAYAKSRQTGAARIILTKTGVVANPGTKWEMVAPYTSLAGRIKEPVDFTVGGLSRFMKQHAIPLAMNFVFQDGCIQSFIILFSVFFIALAAFIFKLESGINFGGYVTLAVFAISPLVFGICVASLAGVRIPWVWHIFVFLSTIVMFRGVQTVAKSRMEK